MTGLTVFAMILGSCVLASALHELTHYVTALLVGRRPKFRLREYKVVWAVDEVRPKDWAIAAAPIGVGLLAAAGALLAFRPVWWLIPAWYLFTVHGAVTNDLALNEFDGDARSSVSDAN